SVEQVLLAGEPEARQGGQGLRLDPPPALDGVEVRLVDRSPFDPRERREDRGDAERLGNRPTGVEPELLREGGHRPGDVDGARGRGELTGHQPQEGRLAGAVTADEAGPTAGEGPADRVEGTGAVGPVEGDVGEGDEGIRPRGRGGHGRSL